MPKKCKKLPATYLAPDSLPACATPGFKLAASPGCFRTPSDGQRTTSFFLLFK